MVIESISEDQEGWYRHQATDSRGSATKDVYIKVIPGTPSRLSNQAELFIGGFKMRLLVTHQIFTIDFT